VSDGVSKGQREDRSGPALELVLRGHLAPERLVRLVLPDERGEISRKVVELCDGGANLVLLTGGTGVGPRDRTPEALSAVLDLQIPGLPEKMRAETGTRCPAACLSRQVAGTRGRTLVLALPGSPEGAVDCFESIVELIPHVLELLAGGGASHPRQ
jgi:phosphoribosylanthranilate isomerase